MKEKEINGLIDSCVHYFTNACYTVSRISKYRSLWRNGILRFMKEQSISIYTPEVGLRYISEKVSKEDLRHEDREKIRSIQVLDDYLNLGYIRKNTTECVRHTLEGSLGEEMKKLIVHLRTLRRSQVTINCYELYLSIFLKYLYTQGVQTPNSITEYHIIKFISNTENNKINIVSSLRVLFRFWFDQHIISKDKESILRNYRWIKKERIPSYYTSEEVAKIESSVDHAGGSGKRDYAMLLLATRLGLRGSDIANLRFFNIDWEKCIIKLIQYKTKESIELPLLADVGNAIIDYLKYGRVESDSDHIFLSTRAPYVNSNGSMVCSAINNIISKAGVSIKYRHHGAHSMRHSLASTMLENGVSFPVISESLGHRFTSSTMTYLKIDINSLQMCALPVQPVNADFYVQKGGAFYE
ncbi:MULTISPECIES: site-specific integrase [Bacteroidales]|uniref:Site-specific recombinase XerD n=1 Tax=Bacteroides ovatus TaxID=28116 RepID=A0A1G8ENT2_BACOV|nr:MULTISPECIES: site-specific integrase [Bacteroidales]MCL3854231.1 tyrosine-type recombinase/integrase [Parabacteroides leei]SDH71512.1 Site-specific recombinase XerD [Bacteroides ovatus]